MLTEESRSAPERCSGSWALGWPWGGEGGAEVDGEIAGSWGLGGIGCGWRDVAGSWVAGVWGGERSEGADEAL